MGELRPLGAGLLSLRGTASTWLPAVLVNIQSSGCVADLLTGHNNPKSRIQAKITSFLSIGNEGVELMDVVWESTVAYCLQFRPLERHRPPGKLCVLDTALGHTESEPWAHHCESAALPPCPCLHLKYCHQRGPAILRGLRD